MAKRKRRSERPDQQEKIVFRSTDAIGTAAAENDTLLRQCFVDSGYLNRLADTSAASPCIVLGRTGCGKSALLLEFERRYGAIRLAPESLALSHISQSTIIGVLAALGVKLEPFYKLLWRHFFCINTLAACFGSMSSLENWFSGLKPNVRKARRYLEEWAGKDFFQNARTVSTQLTQTLENKVSAGLKGKGVELRAVQGMSAQERTEVVPICQDIITHDLAEQLQAVMQLTRTLLDDVEPIYFVIDGLDEDWVQEDQRYLLIMGLLQTLSDFRGVPNSKILAALRRDLLEEVYSRARPAGFQEEKLQDLYLPVHWSNDELIALLDRRIETVLKDRYQGRRRISHVDVLPSTIHTPLGKVDTVTYLLSRTHSRPRDAIAFMNQIIKRAKSGTPSVTNIREAERSYSDDRLTSVADEWHVQEPGLKDLARVVLRDQQSRFTPDEVDENKVRDRAMKYALRHEDGNHLTREFANGALSFSAFLEHALLKLYQFGIVRLKAGPNDKFRTGLDDGAPTEVDELDVKGKVEVHPMFWQALTIRIVGLGAG